MSKRNAHRDVDAVTYVPAEPTTNAYSHTSAGRRHYAQIETMSLTWIVAQSGAAALFASSFVIYRERPNAEPRLANYSDVNMLSSAFGVSPDDVTAALEKGEEEGGFGDPAVARAYMGVLAYGHGKRGGK